MLMTLPTGYDKSLCYQSLPLVYDKGRTILVAILFQFLPSLESILLIHSINILHRMILHCNVGRYIMCQYGFMHNSCTYNSPNLLHTRSPHPSQEGLALRLLYYGGGGGEYGAMVGELTRQAIWYVPVILDGSCWLQFRMLHINTYISLWTV